MSSIRQWISKYKVMVEQPVWEVLDFGIVYIINNPTLYTNSGAYNGDTNLDAFLTPEFVFAGVLNAYLNYMEVMAGRLYAEDKERQKQEKRHLERCFYQAISKTEVKKFIQDVCDKYFPKNQKLKEEDYLDELVADMDVIVKESWLDEKRTKEFVKQTKQLFETARIKKETVSLVRYLEFCKEFEKAVKSGKSLGTGSFVDISEYYVELRKKLSEKVVCQDSAIRKFVQGLFTGKMREENNKKGPESSFLFVGPPGVGKTFLAQTMAELSERPFKIFQMNEYAASQSYEGLVGFAETYSKSKPGELTEFVSQNPDAVLLFDEIEKAHLNTIRLFLSILEGGFLKDLNTERDVDFTNTVIIFTTNAGRDFYEEKRDELISAIPEATIIDAIKKEKKANKEPVMPTEILSRMSKGNIIGFDHMNPAKLVPIIKKGMEKGKNLMESTFGLTCDYDESVLPYMFLFYLGSQLDARVASGRSSQFMKECIYHLSERIGENKADLAQSHISSVSFEVQDEALAREFIVPEEKSKVLLVSYRADRERFEVTDGDRFERLDAWDQQDEQGNQVLIANILSEHKIHAILVDPFMTGKTMEDDPEELEGLLHMNTHGNNVLRWLMKQQNMPPVYALELRNQISLADRLELQRQGVRDVINLIGMSAKESKETINNLVYELFLASKLEKLVSKGRSMDFDIGHRIDEDRIVLKLHNFRLITNMSADAVDVFVSDAETPGLCFEDVIGAESAKEELRRFIRYMKEPEEYKRSGQQVSKGILLYGPPGTGKTILAKALAAEADCPFIATTGEQFVNGTKQMNKVFALARKYAPSIIFIDEIDSFALDRKQTDSTRATVLNNLLTEMDGFSTTLSKPVFVIAATNAADAPGLQGTNIYLDSALQRRFSKKVYVDLPNREERYSYLKKCSAKYQKKTYNLNALSEEDMEEIARITAGHSLAEIENVINLAMGRAAEREEIPNKDLLVSCFEEMVYGEKQNVAKSHLMTTALHEAGHAFMGFECGERFYPEFATLVARASFLGMVQMKEDEGNCGYSKDDFLKRIRIKLAGRATELVFNGPDAGLTTGAGNDLEGATYFAQSMLSRYGMEEGFLPVIPAKEMLRSPLANQYYAKLNEILVREMDYTTGLIENNKDKIQNLAEALVESSRLDTKQMQKILYGICEEQ